MAVTRASAKALFQRGDRPTSAEFSEIFDSLPIAPTTAAQIALLGVGAVGSAVFGAATTASAQTELGGGAAGRAIFGAAATANAVSQLDLAATTAQMSAPTNTSSAFTTPGRQHYHPLHPKGWVHFNGAGTVSIREAWNVASIGDIGTGHYRVSWGSAFGNANYGVAGIGANNPNGSGAIISLNVASAGDLAAGDAKVLSSIVSGAATLSDISAISVWAISR